VTNQTLIPPSKIEALREDVKHSPFVAVSDMNVQTMASSAFLLIDRLTWPAADRVELDAVFSVALLLTDGRTPWRNILHES
jgi:hypothetical protein